MLPSFRLIAATFLCGFVVVFAGLRLAASLNDIHESAPVMAAHAAPTSMAPAADREVRRGLSSVPVMYDLRFAVSTVSPALVRIAPTVLDRPAPPMIIVPPEDLAEPAKEPPQPESSVAAIPPDAPAVEAPQAPAGVDIPADPPPAAAQEPAPPAAATDPAPDEPSASGPTATAPAASSSATPGPAADIKAAGIEPQTTPAPEAAAIEPPIGEPGTTGSVATPEQDAKPAVPKPVVKPQAARSAPKAKAVAVANVVR
jgi:hypothetical protein